MILDAHTHIHPDPRGFGPTRDASVDGLLKNMRAAGIAQAVVLAIEPDMGNAFVAETCASHSELIGFASLNPLNPEAADAAIADYLVTGRMHGVKLHPRRQGFGIADKKAVIELVEKVAARDVPILIDAFPQGSTYFQAQEVRLIHEVAAAVPSARIIMAHCGGMHVLDALMVVKANRNVVVDVSFTPFWFAGSSVATDLAFVLRKIGPQRILHGSDSPEVPLARAIDDTLALCAQCGFNDSERELVLSGNALRILPRTVAAT